MIVIYGHMYECEPAVEAHIKEMSAEIEKLKAENKKAHGHWIEEEDHGKKWFRCSQCGEYEKSEQWFCPYCGADMNTEEVNYESRT